MVELFDKDVPVEHERDLGFQLRLQHMSDGYVLVIRTTHIGEQHASSRVSRLRVAAARFSPSGRFYDPPGDARLPGPAPYSRPGPDKLFLRRSRPEISHEWEGRALRPVQPCGSCAAARAICLRRRRVQCPLSMDIAAIRQAFRFHVHRICCTRGAADGEYSLGAKWITQ